MWAFLNIRRATQPEKLKERLAKQKSCGALCECNGCRIGINDVVEVMMVCERGVKGEMI